MSPGHTRRVLLILPRLSLPPDCSASLTVSRSDKGQASSVFSSCSSTQHPVILTGEPPPSVNVMTPSLVPQVKATTSGWSSSPGPAPCPRGSSSACSQSRVSRGKCRDISLTIYFQRSSATWWMRSSTRETSRASTVTRARETCLRRIRSSSPGDDDNHINERSQTLLPDCCSSSTHHIRLSLFCTKMSSNQI